MSEPINWEGLVQKLIELQEKLQNAEQKLASIQQRADSIQQRADSIRGEQSIASALRAIAREMQVANDDRHEAERAEQVRAYWRHVGQYAYLSKTADYGP